MNAQTNKNAMGDVRKKLKHDLLDIPTACQYGNLCSNDTHRIHNENVSWLMDRNEKLPIWSRLKLTNCDGHPRQMMFSHDKDYEIEIPGRLLSIFGNTKQQTKLFNKMKDLANHQLVANVLALCSALRYNFRDWSANLLDKIAAQTTQIYPELLKKLNTRNKEMHIFSLNQIYQFNDDNYQVQLQEVATGYLYIRYGLNEFNLARALNWFFRNHQFGLIQSHNRTLAFGFTIDTEFSFFMYDCQSRGHPIFEHQQANSYILRTRYLQILLYCLIITLNVSMEMIKFVIYNVDIRILNPIETKTLKKEIYVPTIVRLPKNQVAKKIDCGTIHRKTNNKPFANSSRKCSKTDNTLNLTAKNNLKSSKSLTPNTFKKSNTESTKNENTNKKILLDPNKTYYILAVPKQSNITLTKSESKQYFDSKESNEKPKETTQENFKNVKIKNNQAYNNYDEVSGTETLYLNKTASTATLTPHNLEDYATQNLNPTELKVYLVDNSKTSVAHKSSN